MRIEASIENRQQHHAVAVSTNGIFHELGIPPTLGAPGSSVNGGEMLCVALATCYCNDLYREAKQRGVEVLLVNVDVQAEFGGPGEPAKSLSYRASVAARSPEEKIRELMPHTDKVAEIQNTLRRGMAVSYEIAEILSED
ncbi:MAG: OsmC family protein [Bacillota bacterium]